MSEKGNAQNAEISDAGIVVNFVDMQEKKYSNIVIHGILETLSILPESMHRKIIALLSKTFEKFGACQMELTQIIKTCGVELQKARNGENFSSLAEVIKQVGKEKEDINTYGN